jgi:hypothetical protein
MSENLELDQITKSLNQIISSLNDLVNKAPSTPSLLQAPPNRIRKTPDMTYHEYLVKVLANRTPVEVTSAKQSYQLQEDLELLLELSAFGSINMKSFEEIAERKKVNRSVEGLRSRYNDYLSRIGEAEMKKIVSWVEREGLEGYLFFEEKELRISLSDPKEVKKEEQSDKKRPRNPSLEAGEKKFDRKGK